MPTIQDLIREAEAERTAAERAANDAKAALKRFRDGLEAEGVLEHDWTPQQVARADQLLRQHREAKDRIPEIDGRLAAFREVETEEAEHDRLASITRPTGVRYRGGDAGGVSTREAAADWARRGADTIERLRQEQRAITSGSIDIPSLVPTAVQAMDRPQRLLDLIILRTPLAGNAFEFLRQTVRTNNAAPVADHGTKPTSIFTVTPVEDRARVVAHLSEPVPLRIFDDHAQVGGWLESEMAEGVLSALEFQIVQGDGTGENLTGILETTGTTGISFATDKQTSLRKARTALTDLGVTPTAWVLGTADAEALDLEREGAEGSYLANGPGYANIFGDDPIVVSPSLPAGVALLGDFDTAVRLYVREDVRLDVDTASELFDKNEAKLRAEGRFGFALLRPPAVAVIETVSAG